MLTARKKVFIDVYKSTRNATESAKKAGYSVKTARVQGSRLLTDADVKNAIELFESEQREQLTKENFVATAWKEYKETTVEALKPRYLEIAARACGYFEAIGPQTVHNTLILNNLETDKLPSPEKWDKIRGLLE